METVKQIVIWYDVRNAHEEFSIFGTNNFSNNYFSFVRNFILIYYVKASRILVSLRKASFTQEHIYISAVKVDVSKNYRSYIPKIYMHIVECYLIFSY